MKPDRLAEFRTAMETDCGDACREWRGAKNSHGYGVLRHNGAVHRAALEWKLGRAIGAGLLALHTCDNRACFNPRHLYEGTNKDNNADMVSRSRCNARKGTDHHASKMTEDKVRAIRTAYANGGNQYVLAGQFEISQQAISKIVNRKRWVHVD